MDAGLRTPLIDAFRRPDVPVEVRLDAAEGHLAPRLLEHLALLLLLLDDEDAGVRAAAERTLTTVPADRVAGVLAQSDAPAEMIRVFAARGVTPAASAAPPEPATDSGDDEWAVIADDSGEAAADTRDESITQQIQKMNVVQRVRAAMKGSREMRALLVRDANKMVAAAVLSSPKLTLAEVESFAKMANLSEDTLRTIGQNRAWSKSYTVASALTRNPKTPVALSLTMLPRLTDRDVKTLSTDRNVPEAVRMAARKRASASRQG